MSGKSKQAKVKRDKRAADMSPEQPEPMPDEWRPPADECEEHTYLQTPMGADPEKERVQLRIVSHIETGRMVEFAMTHQTKHKGKWRYVVVADSSHDDEVHLHCYGKRGGKKGAKPEILTRVQNADDLQDGYNLAYERVFGVWSANRKKWNDG